MGGFRTGLLVGILLAAVVGLSIALVVALGDDQAPQAIPAPQPVPPTNRKSEPIPPERDLAKPDSLPDEVEDVSFTSPSGNITCRVDVDSANCGILEFVFTLPPTPDGCEQGWGHSFQVRLQGVGEMICASQPPASFGERVLKYGTGLRFASFECDSSPLAILCENLDTGHGFVVSRERFRTY